MRGLSCNHLPLGSKKNTDLVQLQKFLENTGHRKDAFQSLNHMLHSLLLNFKYLEAMQVLMQMMQSSLHILSSGLGTGKGSVKLKNYKTQKLANITTNYFI